MSPKTSSQARLARPAEDLLKKKKEQQQQHSNAKKPAANIGQKKTTHPNEQKQQAIGQQQQRNQKPGRKSGGGGGTNNELDTKVSKLSDKNESCREQIRANLDAFSKKGTEMKDEIGRALEKQVEILKDQESVTNNVEQLRERMLELSREPPLLEQVEPAATNEGPTQSEAKDTNGHNHESSDTISLQSNGHETKCDEREKPKAAEATAAAAPGCCTKNEDLSSSTGDESAHDPLLPSADFEPLMARLDPKTKFITLRASLERHFVKAPELLDPVCNRLLMLSRQIDLLVQANDRNQSEIAKLTLIKSKLGDLCRELQKSNNSIRIDSLNMIKSEQVKAKEQAGKIQATLAGVMKLFDENQQRNLALKQENVDLQTKLKALLDHCGQWEKCVETALKQRDIENCLIKTELKRLGLLRAEEQERYLKEKQDLLRMIDVLRAHQGKVEDKEAKLRSDLSSYASKYDECQEIIQKGLGKFQIESKRMLKQIEKSRQDYLVLLNKYESSNKKIKELLEEKQSWVKSMAQANKKVETLERLCRTLKLENDKLTTGKPTVVLQASNETGPTAASNERHESNNEIKQVHE